MGSVFIKKLKVILFIIRFIGGYLIGYFFTDLDNIIGIMMFSLGILILLISGIIEKIYTKKYEKKNNEQMTLF